MLLWPKHDILEMRVSCSWVDSISNSREIIQSSGFFYSVLDLLNEKHRWKDDSETSSGVRLFGLKQALSHQAVVDLNGSPSVVVLTLNTLHDL